jgi:hypothetical protein
MSKAFTRFGTYQPSSEGKQHFKEITSKYDIQGLDEIMETLQILSESRNSGVRSEVDFLDNGVHC